MPTNTSATAALAWLHANDHKPRTAAEALALTVHALLLTHGFRPAQAAASDPADAPAPSDLPTEWGAAGFGGRYRHVRSAMTFDVRAAPVGARLIFNATALEDDAQLHTLELRVPDHVDPALSFTDPPAVPDWRAVLPNLDALATFVQVQIAHRLVPDAAKEGYEAAAQATPASSASAAPSVRVTPPPHLMEDPWRRQDPLRTNPLHDDPLRDDPLRIGRPRHPGYGGARAPPLGGDDLLAPGLPRGLGGVAMPHGGMGGNLMGPGSFGGRGDGMLPRPPGVPPGARFDPYGPFAPDPDVERPPGFEDEHGLAGGRGGTAGRLPRGASGGGGFGDGPPPGMYW